MSQKTALLVSFTALIAAVQNVAAVASGQAISPTTLALPTALTSPQVPEAKSTVPRVRPTDIQPPTAKPIRGGVQDTSLLVDTALRQIKQSNDKLSRDTLILANEANRHITPTPMAPNAVGSMVLPPITFNNVSLGPLPPRPQVVRAVLVEVNAEVRRLQQDERNLNETICGLGNDQALMWWNRIVSTTADIIDTYRALEPAALSPRPQSKSLAAPTVHLYDQTKNLESSWQHLREALAAK